jgi:hypothetical protein
MYVNHSSGLGQIKLVLSLDLHGRPCLFLRNTLHKRENARASEGEKKKKEQDERPKLIDRQAAGLSTLKPLPRHEASDVSVKMTGVTSLVAAVVLQALPQ